MTDPARTPRVTALHLVVESRFGLDGGAMFGIVPQPLWAKRNAPDSANRIRMTARLMVLDVDDGRRRVLVDTGMGAAWTEKERGIYAIAQPDGPLREHLRERGIDPDSITDVVMTHLHFDHAGGLLGADGRPAFPNATHHVQRENWVWAHHPTLRDAGSYRRELFAWLGERADARLVLHDGSSQIAGALNVHALYGHTPGMQLVDFVLDGQRYLFGADLLPTAAHVPLAWVMGYDLHPTVSVREKAEWWLEAHRTDAVFVLGHDPDHAFVRLEPKGPDRWEVAERWDAAFLTCPPAGSAE